MSLKVLAWAFALTSESLALVLALNTYVLALSLSLLTYGLDYETGCRAAKVLVEKKHL